LIAGDIELRVSGIGIPRRRDDKTVIEKRLSGGGSGRTFKFLIIRGGLGDPNQ